MSMLVYYWSSDKPALGEHNVVCWLCAFDSYIAGIYFRRQNLTSEVNPRTVRVELFIMAVDLQHRYSNEAERSKSFMMISIRKKHLDSMLYMKIIQRLKGVITAYL